MARIQNQVLIRFGELFGLTGQVSSPIEVNIESPVALTREIGPSMDWSAGKRRLFTRRLAAVNATNPTATGVDLNTVANWTSIRSSDIGGPGTGAGTGLAQGNANIILGIWFVAADPANFTNARVLVEATAGGQSMPIAQCVAADLIDGSAPSSIGRFPFQPSSFGGLFRLVLGANVAADQNVDFMLDVLTVPLGVYGRI